MSAQEKRAKLYAMAAAAMPQPIFPEGGDERNGGDDWGSKRQIEAANEFHIYVSDTLGIDTEDMATAKADAEDMINEACRRAEFKLIFDELLEAHAAVAVANHLFREKMKVWRNWREWNPKPEGL